MGAWIETAFPYVNVEGKIVAPLVGAWIETATVVMGVFSSGGRTPRGCVD